MSYDLASFLANCIDLNSPCSYLTLCLLLKNVLKVVNFLCIFGSGGYVENAQGKRTQRSGPLLTVDCIQYRLYTIIGTVKKT